MSVACFVLLIAFILRLLPIVIPRKDYGVDHYFWKTYIKTYQDSKKYPPILPQYLLDEEQWYPPLFPIILAHVPQALFDNISRILSIIMDLLRLVLLLYVVWLLTNGDVLKLFISGLAYATTPILVSYNTQLNPRTFGAFFLDALVLITIYGFEIHQSIILIVPIILLSVLILLTHKMTTQLLWFLLIGAFLITQKVLFLGLIIISILIALLLSKGFYWKVLKAHWDIVSFWTRNWMYMGANPLLQSPIYGQTSIPTNNVYQKGLINQLKRLSSIFLGAYCPCIIVTIPILFMSRADGIEINIITWFMLILVFSVLTIVIPVFRGLGFGNLYLYNAAFPNAILLGYNIDWTNQIVVILICIGLILNILQIIRSYKLLTKHNGIYLPDAMIDLIKGMEEGAWLCYPMQLCEHIAARANQKVLWGGHGFGLKTLEKVFPIVTERFEILIQEYNLKYILLHSSYFSTWESISVESKLIFSNDDYRIYELG